jgi:subtilisin family serine protease
MNGSHDELASFSDRGAWVDLAAPGVDIVSTLPCGFGRWSGTSMAAPFVSGEAALIRQTMTKPKAADVIGRLLKGVVKVRGLGVHAGSIDIWRAVTRG